jgi:TonB family protein
MTLRSLALPLALGALSALAGTAAAEGLVVPPIAAPAAQPDGWKPKMIRGSCYRPEYPLASVRDKETGATLVRLTVDEKGNVTQTAIARSSGHARLDTAAADGLSLCKFTPARDSAGGAVPGTALIEHVWRLEDAAPDPWVALRALNGAGRAATADLAAVPFAAPSGATDEQRVKILHGVQDAATRHASCGSIEQVSVAPPPADWKLTPVTDPKTGRELRLVRELWTVTQCGFKMQYALVMRFPEDEGASYTMVPLVPGSK